MGYRHDEADILNAATATATEEGLSALSFGRVAARLQTSDRMVVYYFPTKEKLVGAVLATLGVQLQTLLNDAFGAETRPPAELFQRAWPVLTTRAADRVFAIFFELAGLAAAGREPFRTHAAKVMTDWLEWLSPRIALATVTERQSAALGLIAQLDGLLLLRQTLGKRAANRAAEALGAVTTRKTDNV